MNLPLQGQIRAEVDHVPVISITRVAASERIPGQIKKGGYGTIGAARGIADGSGSFTMAVTTTGPEIDIKALKSKPFTLTWNRGSKRQMATGCVVTEIGDSNTPGDGNYDLNINFIFGDLIEI